jgi:hypothetical protein
MSDIDTNVECLEQFSQQVQRIWDENVIEIADRVMRSDMSKKGLKFEREGVEWFVVNREPDGRWAVKTASAHWDRMTPEEIDKCVHETYDLPDEICLR